MDSTIQIQGQVTQEDIEAAMALVDSDTIEGWEGLNDFTPPYSEEMIEDANEFVAGTLAEPAAKLLQQAVCYDLAIGCPITQALERMGFNAHFNGFDTVFVNEVHYWLDGDALSETRNRRSGKPFTFVLTPAE